MWDRLLYSGLDAVRRYMSADSWRSLYFFSRKQAGCGAAQTLNKEAAGTSANSRGYLGTRKCLVQGQVGEMVSAPV